MRSFFAVLTLAGSLLFGVPLRAQAVERPAAFDSEGRVMTITPALAARLKLTAPTWPVSGDFVEARLYDRGDGTFVVAVQRTGGVVERYPLASDARLTLQQAITASMLSTGNLSTGERQDVVSEPAKGQFVRDQTLAAAFVYGPALASLTGDASAGTAVYLATVGATFFTSAQLAKGRSISKAQNHMATSGTWRGLAIANGLLYVFAGDDVDDDVKALTGLGGAVAGTIIGFRLGLPLTDGEAHGATFGSTFSALGATGLIGTLGGFNGDEARGEVAGILTAAVAGYPLGLRYVRRASYAITPGDITTMSTAGFIGLAAGAAFISDDGQSEQAVAATLTAGLLAGALVGDRVLVRPYDFTESQGRLMTLGALAGGLMGIAIPIAARSENGHVYLGLGAAGAMLGMAMTRGIIEPAIGVRRATQRAGGGPQGQSSTSDPARRKDGPVLRFHPENAGMLLAHPRTRVSVPFVSLSF